MYMYMCMCLFVTLCVCLCVCMAICMYSYVCVHTVNEEHLFSQLHSVVFDKNCQDLW